jgi:hypothetical protein
MGKMKERKKRTGSGGVLFLRESLTASLVGLGGVFYVFYDFRVITAIFLYDDSL